MKATTLLKMAALVLPLLLSSCRSGKPAVAEGPKTTAQQEIAPSVYLQKVQAHNVQQSFVTSKLKFTVELGDQRVSLSGNLRMKRDDVIMLQLMALGFVEAGRLEFTRDYVLIMDRINKQYIKAPYSDVAFLRSSGINFHTLQALFWNELFLPGQQTVDSSMFTRYATTRSSDEVIISLDDEGSPLNYSWRTDEKTGQIKMANIVYRDSSRGNTQLNWDYRAFDKMGQKDFPTDMDVTLTTPDKNMKVGIRLTNLDSKSDWETRTKVSDRYRKVTVEEIFEKLASVGG